MRRLGLSRWTLACGGAAAVVAAVALALGPPGVDAPAHRFQTWVFLHHGFQVWDNYWYAGSYQFVTYSLLYYPIASVTGQAGLATAAAGLLGLAFATLLTQHWGRSARGPALLFAVTGPLALVVSGMYPFLTAAAVATWTVVALRRARRFLALVGAIATAALSPLAFLLMSVAVLAGLLIQPDRRRWLRTSRRLVAGFALLVGLGLVWSRAFTGTGYYPYSATDALTVGAFTLVGMYLTRHRPARDPLPAFFLAYLAANAVCFAVPSPVGSNAIRLFSIAGAPLLWLALRLARRPPGRVVASVIVAGTLAVQLAPFVFDAYASARDTAARAAFWRPTIGYLQTHGNGQFRVEVVATWGHWEAYYLPRAAIPLARGWYRQDDFPHNSILYGDELTPSAYRAWLRSLGVRYVVLPHTRLDYTSTREAELLRSGRSGLRVVQRTRDDTIYALPRATPILTGPRGGAARLLRLGGAALELDLPRAGTYFLRVSFSPYWQASPSGICVRSAGQGMTELQTAHPGRFWLRLRPTIEAVASTLAGQSTPEC